MLRKPSNQPRRLLAHFSTAAVGCRYEVLDAGLGVPYIEVISAALCVSLRSLR
jgi:hypothetical protein